MPTNVQLAAELLRNAATFFRDVGEQNDALQQQMKVKAQTFDLAANLVEKDPLGEMPDPASGG